MLDLSSWIKYKYAAKYVSLLRKSVYLGWGYELTFSNELRFPYSIALVWTIVAGTHVNMLDWHMIQNEVSKFFWMALS